MSSETIHIYIFFLPFTTSLEGKVFSQFYTLVLELCGKRNFFLSFFFFRQKNHFNHMMLFGAIDCKHRFDADGTTENLSESVFLSHGYKLGITALTFRNHSLRNLHWSLALLSTFHILLPRRSPGPVMGNRWGTPNGIVTQGVHEQPLDSHGNIPRNSPTTERGVKKLILLLFKPKLLIQLVELP